MTVDNKMSEENNGNFSCSIQSKTQKGEYSSLKRRSEERIFWQPTQPTARYNAVRIKITVTLHQKSRLSDTF